MKNKPKTVTLKLTREGWEKICDTVDKAWDKVELGEATVAEEVLVLVLSNSGIEKGSYIEYEYNTFGQIPIKYEKDT